jgi:hypothetical protein
LIALVFNFVVAVAFHLLGASLATSWFMFLALMGLALADLEQTLADISATLSSMKGKLDTVSKLI